MEKIKSQAGKVSELIFAADTGATYKKAITLTWAILRETGVLLWLVICLVFVGGEWFWQNSISLGQSARNWYEGLQTSSEAESKSATEIGQSALSAVGTGAGTLLYQAKKQLGIDAEPPAPKPQKPKAETHQAKSPAPEPPPAPSSTAVPDSPSTTESVAPTSSSPSLEAEASEDA
ncbi:hypothetical protein [Leptolyngbya iicbica]|uniref:Uncharacterized protein n=2 Tax=Cyanophyceae TaxID=3028117 RepID=A0A4Q7E3D1_9CYAN|nr:hypothetical protein [Leptolyngbya sp. LK]RZM76512.1 hypothetical protein DYY88_17740 [Leptolyngbya sp. LK]